MKILMVLTSHAEMGDTGEKTGFWLEEFASPFYVFKDAGVEITLASPKGGVPPVDPRSEAPEAQTPSTQRLKADAESLSALTHTIRLGLIKAEGFDAVFFPGGHGPLWDLSNDPHVIRLIETTLATGKPVGAVCHAPAVLLHTKARDGTPLILNRQVTGFSNSEEEAAGLTQVVPFLLEDSLKKTGGIYSKGEDWGVHVVTDGLLVTGQNPASSEKTAQTVLELLRQENP